MAIKNFFKKKEPVPEPAPKPKLAKKEEVPFHVQQAMEQEKVRMQAEYARQHPCEPTKD